MTDRVRQDFYFAQIPEWLLRDHSVSPQAVRLYGALQRFAGSSGECFPSRKTLSEWLGVGTKSVDRALTELVDASAVTVRQRYDEAGDRASNLYVVHLAPPEGVGSRMTPPLDSSDPTGGVKSDAGGGVKSDALTRAIPEREPTEREGGSLTLATSTEPDGTDDATEPREDVERICEHLAAEIERNGSKPPTITKRWRDAARLLLDRDQRAEEQVHRAIDWCQNDDFWRTNVLSMPKLREKYDQLRLAAERERTRGAGTSRGPDWDQMLARAQARDAAAQQHPQEGTS